MQNYFLVSLAAADLAVATLVMPLHVVKFLAGGKWLLGMTVCQMFTTFDILCCTASILNLCAIALDRYQLDFYIFFTIFLGNTLFFIRS